AALVKDLQARGQTAFGLGVADFDLGRLSFTSVGDDSVAFRSKARLTAGRLFFDVVVDVIMVRTGHVGASLIYTSVPERPNLDEELRLTRILRDRARKVDSLGVARALN